MAAIRIISVSKFVGVDKFVLLFIFNIGLNELVCEIPLQGLVVSRIAALGMTLRSIRAPDGWRILSNSIVWHNILIVNTQLSLVTSSRQNLSIRVLARLGYKRLLGEGDAMVAISRVSNRVSRALMELVVVFKQLLILGTWMWITSSAEIGIRDSLEPIFWSGMRLLRVTPVGIFICIECRHLSQMILAGLVLLLSPALIWLTSLDIVD